MAIETEGSSHVFIPVETSPAPKITVPSELIVPNDKGTDRLAQVLGIDIIRSPSKYDVYLWHNPLTCLPVDQYPNNLRSFTPVETTDAERSQARRMIETYGPIIPRTRSEYSDKDIQQIEEKNRQAVIYEVPPHQARGFKDQGIYVFIYPDGQRRIKTTAATKGSGTCGYWRERRLHEMRAALDGKINDYPLNPDPFHARNRAGQATGSKNGDDVVWVGCASDTVTQREVNGFTIFQECGIFHPECLPVRKYDQLPLGTGEFIDTKEFTTPFATNTHLVHLIKAWASEQRLWGNTFNHTNMTAAHLLSVQDGGKFHFQNILEELRGSAQTRKVNLRKEEQKIARILRTLDRKHWDEFIGPAGNVLTQSLTNETFDPQTIIPTILSINMTENAAAAGAHRIWGKPVAWHLENIGRLGEVSGGERIYGKATGKPETMEIHSLFAYMFDAYAAIAIEWASSNMSYMTFEQFFQTVRTKILQKNNAHWINQYPDVNTFVMLCQSHHPDYQVNYRSEDAFPLVAVPGTTDPTIEFKNAHGVWKNWNALEHNLNAFVSGIRQAYSK
jgi:hypothetical protein